MFLFPSFPRASARPMLIVVFPSPNFVGVIAVTIISFPSGLSLFRV